VSSNVSEPQRSDALASRERILEAARQLSGDRRLSMSEVAAAAGVGRSTLYRHFPTRQALEAAALRARGVAELPTDAVVTLGYQPPGRLGRSDPLPPEIVPEGLRAYADRLRLRLPGCVLEPLWLRGRVLGLLLCIGAPLAPLEDIAKQGAAALELANDYTDEVEAARRHKKTTPAAEIQQNLFPPRIARIAGAQLAGGLLPTYEVGGDWFDFVENRDGAWLAIADAAGKGPTAAGPGAAALGALRAARRSDYDLVDAVAAMHETVRLLGNADFRVTALVARWRAATSAFTWVNCGHSPPYLVGADGNVQELDGPGHPALGSGPERVEYAPTQRQLRSGERLILVTDGILDRRVEGGGTFGFDGIRTAVGEAESPTAAATAMSILQAVTDCWREPLQDDGTAVVLAVT
jgi:serine phosphatase RsbU (regulator of sigma subunit)